MPAIVARIALLPDSRTLPPTEIPRNPWRPGVQPPMIKGLPHNLWVKLAAKRQFRRAFSKAWQGK